MSFIIWKCLSTIRKLARDRPNKQEGEDTRRLYNLLGFSSSVTTVSLLFCCLVPVNERHCCNSGDARVAKALTRVSNPEFVHQPKRNWLARETDSAETIPELAPGGGRNVLPMTAFDFLSSNFVDPRMDDDFFGRKWTQNWGGFEIPSEIA